MSKNKEYLEDINTREFYEFYRKVRRKPSKKIDQYNYYAIENMVFLFLLFKPSIN